MRQLLNFNETDKYAIMEHTFYFELIIYEHSTWYHRAYILPVGSSKIKYADFSQRRYTTPTSKIPSIYNGGNRTRYEWLFTKQYHFNKTAEILTQYSNYLGYKYDLNMIFNI